MLALQHDGGNFLQHSYLDYKKSNKKIKNK